MTNALVYPAHTQQTSSKWTTVRDKHLASFNWLERQASIKQPQTEIKYSMLVADQDCRLHNTVDWGKVQADYCATSTGG